MRQTKKTLHENEAILRGLFEHAPDAIIVVNDQGIMTRVNTQAEKMFNYSRAELLGQPLEMLLPERFRERHVSHRLDFTAEARLRPMGIGLELFGQRKNRHEFPVDIMLSPLETTTGGMVIAVIRDITEKKHLQEQLLQAQKIEAIGRLAGGVAHDFNNMLVVITGYCELLLQRHLSEQDPLRPYVEAIQKAGERAAMLTRQLLAFSRKQILQPEVLNLNAVIMNLENMLRRLISEDIDLIMVPVTELGQVKADLGQLEQVILNLAINARDAMPQGGKLIIETANIELDEIYTYQYLEVTPGRYVMLVVSDTGIGMDAETQSHVFEPFYTTKEAGKGTGLGLATIYGIIKQSGGHIAVYSEPGRGTTFKVYLPRIDEAVEPAESNLTLIEPPQGTQTILVVEDEIMVRELICRILDQKGYTVLPASSGSEALQVYDQPSTLIHLLLTDVVMPGGVNGRELAEHLAPLYPGMKVLYISGYTEDAIIHHRVLDPDVAFLHKPFTPNDLIRKVQEVLSAP